MTMTLPAGLHELTYCILYNGSLLDQGSIQHLRNRATRLLSSMETGDTDLYSNWSTPRLMHRSPEVKKFHQQSQHNCLPTSQNTSRLDSSGEFPHASSHSEPQYSTEHQSPFYRRHFTHFRPVTPIGSGCEKTFVIPKLRVKFVPRSALSQMIFGQSRQRSTSLFMRLKHQQMQSNTMNAPILASSHKGRHIHVHHSHSSN